MRLSGSINLLAYKDAKVIVGPDSTEYVAIPIAKNHLVHTIAPSGKENCYSNINIWDKKQPDRFGNTFTMKPSIKKDMSEDEIAELKGMFLGDLKNMDLDTEQRADFPRTPDPGATIKDGFVW